MNKLSFSKSEIISPPLANEHTDVWIEIESDIDADGGLLGVNIKVSVGSIYPVVETGPKYVKRDGYMLSDFRYIVERNILEVAAELFSSLYHDVHVSKEVILIASDFLGSVKEVSVGIWYPFLEAISE